MMVVCLSGSFIISDTFVWWMSPDDAGSDICLMAACRNKDTHRNSIAAIIHISTAEFQK